MARTRPGSREARGRILAAGEALFAAKGFSGTAVREIAARAEVNPAMIHYYFKNKEGLYRSVLENGAAGVAGLIQGVTAAGGSITEQLTRFIASYARFVLSHPNLARVLHRELLAEGRMLKQLRGPGPVRNYQMLRELIGRGIRSGELREVDLELAPVSLLGMVVVFQTFQPMILSVLGRKRYDEEFIERLSRHTVDLFLSGASKRPEKRELSASVSSPRKSGRRGRR